MYDNIWALSSSLIFNSFKISGEKTGDTNSGSGEETGDGGGSGEETGDGGDSGEKTGDTNSGEEGGDADSGEETSDAGSGEGTRDLHIDPTPTGDRDPLLAAFSTTSRGASIAAALCLEYWVVPCTFSCSSLFFL